MNDGSWLPHGWAALLVIAASVIALCALVQVLTRPADRRFVLLTGLVGLGLHIAVTLGTLALGATGKTLRGPDDPPFYYSAQILAGKPFTDGLWPSEVAGDGLTVVNALQLKLLGDPGATSLRLTQGLIAVLALVVILVVVRELSGRKALWIAAVLLLLEPTTLLFTSVLQKESMVLLGEALCLLGILRLAHQNRPRSGVACLIAGIGIVASVRPYAAGFLAAGVGIYLGVHTVIAAKRTAVIAGVVALGAVGLLAFVGSGASARALDRLQEFQDLETSGDSNLRLAPVDYTTLSGFAEAVPRRIIEFVVRPEPWAAENLEQTLGAFGTIFAWALMAAVLSGIVLRRRRIQEALPILILAAAIGVGYAVTSANAGTGFRHRLHLLAFLGASAGALWAHSPVVQRLTTRSGTAIRAYLRRPASLGRSVSSAATFLALRYAAVAILNLVGSVTLIRELGPENWASYSVAFFLATFFDQHLGTRVLGALISARDSPSPRAVATATMFSVAMGLAGLTVLLIVAQPVDHATELPDVGACLTAAGVCALVLSIRAPAAALLERELRFGWLALAEVLDQMVFLGIAIPLVLAGEGIGAVALALALRGVPSALLLLVLARPRLRPKPSLATLKTTGAFAAPVLAVAAFALLDGLMPLLWLGSRDATELGFVTTAASLVSYAAVGTLIAQRLAFSALSTARREAAAAARMAANASQLSVIVVGVMVLPIAFAEFWIPSLLGDRWEGTGQTFAAVGIGFFLMCPISIVQGLLYSAGRPTRAAVLFAAMTGVYASTLAFGVFELTAFGVALAFATSRLMGLALGTAIAGTASEGYPVASTLLPAIVVSGGLAVVAAGTDMGSAAVIGGGLLVLAAGFAQPASVQVAIARRARAARRA